jgi:hypothetical protein
VSNNRWRILHICILTFIFVLLTLFYYSQLLYGVPIIGQSAGFSSGASLGYAIERIIYILLIVYAGWSLGLVAGISTLVASSLAMLPQAVIMYPQSVDALLEVLAALAIGGMGITGKL